MFAPPPITASLGIGASDHIGNLPEAPSGAQQHRLSVVRALANDLSLILPDEPTAALLMCSSGQWKWKRIV